MQSLIFQPGVSGVPSLSASRIIIVPPVMCRVNVPLIVCDGGVFFSFFFF